jgi:hypothetical protein
MKKYPVTIIISGGQSGVDRAALDFALENSIICCGWCPKGRKAEDGPIAEKYPLLETDTELYQQRTRMNVKDSDATLIISDGKRSRGTDLTAKCANHYFRPLLAIKSAEKEEIARLLAWLHLHKPRILNVAGPRGSESSTIYQLAKRILQQSLKPSREKSPGWPPPKPTTPDLF